jgi:hypothetical protein
VTDSGAAESAGGTDPFDGNGGGFATSAIGAAICDRRVERAVMAFADEKYGGDWRKVTVIEFFGIVAVLKKERR